MGEALAARSALYACKDELRGLRLLHFIDNQSAQANLIAGSSRCSDVATIVVWYQLPGVDANVTPWFEYVESHLNISDLPSRLLEAFVNHPLAKRLGIKRGSDASLPPL